MTTTAQQQQVVALSCFNVPVGKFITIWINVDTLPPDFVPQNLVVKESQQKRRKRIGQILWYNFVFNFCEAIPQRDAANTVSDEYRCEVDLKHSDLRIDETGNRKFIGIKLKFLKTFVQQDVPSPLKYQSTDKCNNVFYLLICIIPFVKKPNEKKFVYCWVPLKFVLNSPGSNISKKNNKQPICTEIFTNNFYPDNY